ncbi:hypothetical protein ABT272_44510, partial [Streptomyces sp900105245]
MVFAFADVQAQVDVTGDLARHAAPSPSHVHALPASLTALLTSACQGEAGAGYEAVEGVGLVLESFEAV